MIIVNKNEEENETREQNRMHWKHQHHYCFIIDGLDFFLHLFLPFIGFQLEFNAPDSIAN